MAEAQGNDLVRRSDIYKLFDMRGTATLHVAQIDQLPAVDVMKLPTVQRLEKELAEIKMSLAIARLGEIAKKSAPKILPAKKVKPLNVKALAKGHADGIRTTIHIVDEWSAAGPKPTPPREIILDLKPGDIVAFASKEKIKQYGTGLFEVKQVFWGMAQLADKSNKYRTPIADIKELKLVKRVGQPGGKEQ